MLFPLLELPLRSVFFCSSATWTVPSLFMLQQIRVLEWPHSCETKNWTTTTRREMNSGG
ncbi:unnamed protein product [Amoebophrya sp. A120]|nr:unnamed protein product [Amoebophrya sp. A120]|eukprot:GSA120T00020428001.1